MAVRHSAGRGGQGRPRWAEWYDKAIPLAERLYAAYVTAREKELDK
ncbi:hypothetical protein [Streptomyces sp. NPDC050585]